MIETGRITPTKKRKKKKKKKKKKNSNTRSPLNKSTDEWISPPLQTSETAMHLAQKCREC